MSQSGAVAPSEAPTALVKRPTGRRMTVYEPPRPGRSMRSSMRSLVLLSGSVGIGAGVALGAIAVPHAILAAVGLATFQVVAQSFHQNRLGQDVMGGIARGDLDQALLAAERALLESPAGAMRTLAAANLASVLMQLDRIRDGARVLDEHRPRWPHVPIATVLWENNRAFALSITPADADAADALLDDAERRLEKAGPRGFGGVHNFKKIAGALAGTRAMQCLVAGDPKAALQSLARAESLDDGAGAPFRVVERTLCRAESLRQLGRRDEAILVAIELFELPRTYRQSRATEALAVRLDIPFPQAGDEQFDEDAHGTGAVDDDAFAGDYPSS